MERCETFLNEVCDEVKYLQVQRYAFGQRDEMLPKISRLRKFAHIQVVLIQVDERQDDPEFLKGP